MPQQVRLLKVFVSCPSDVNKEKSEVKQACETLEKIYCDPQIKIEVIDWKGNVSPLITGDEPQTVINDQIGDFDIYVGIFWKRFGKKQSNALTPTEEEFQRAYNSFKKNGNPLILVYFRIDESYPRNIYEAEQTLQVLKFKEQIKPLGLYREFREKENFVNIIIKDIADKINKYNWLRIPNLGSKKETKG